MKRRLLVLFGVWGLSIFAVFAIASDAFAAYSSANYWNCINESNAGSVDSVMDACDRASNSPNSPGYGALWINGSSWVEDSDVISTSQTSGSITIYLHGKMYRLNSGSSGAYNIHLCNNYVGSSHQLGNCYEKDYLSLNSRYLNRGSNSKSGWHWTTGYNTLAMTLNIDKFVRSPSVSRYDYGSSVQYFDTVEVYRCPTSSASGNDCYSSTSYISIYFPYDPVEPDPPCTGCCPGDPYYPTCIPPDVPDPGEFTDSYDMYEDVYIGDSHSVSNISGSSYSSGYYVLDKTTSSTYVGFAKSLSVIGYDPDVLSKTDDALSRANDALDYYQNSSGTYSLANGEERGVCDGFDYPSYVRYKVHVIEHYDTEPVYGPEGNIVDYVQGAWMYDTIDTITYSSMGNYTDSTVCANIYRNAEALFGLESSGTAQNSNIVDYPWRTDLAHAAPSGRILTTSFSTGPTSVSAATGAEIDPLRRTIFLTTKDEDHITLSYSHSISRGLSTTYESYQPSTTNIRTPWSISYTINGSQKSSDAGSVSSSAPSGGLSTSHVATHTRNVENGDVKFGTYSEAHCETLSHSGIAGITVPIGPTIMSEQPLSTTACLNLFRPWNFELSISTTLDEDDDNHILIADGNSTSASVRVQNHVHLDAEDADYDGRHASRSPEDTKIGIYQFIIGGDVDASIATNSIFGGEVISGVSDIRSAISSRLTSIVSLYQDLTGDTQTISGGILTGKEATHSLSVSKDTNIPAGAKICVVAAVNYVSSEYINDGRGEGYGVYGSSAEVSARNTWLTSNISCRTVTSKSLLQIHGGDIMTGGTIDAAAMKIGGTTFNSWADYGIVAIGDVNTADYAGVSSGAFGAFGRDTSGTNTLCDISHIVVANDRCSIDPVSDREIGKSGIYPDTKLIDTVMARFNATKINGVTIYDVGSTTTKHPISYVNGDGTPVVSDDHISTDPVSGQYYYLRDLERAGDGGHPSTSLDHGTEIIRVTDDAGLIISEDLYYASGNYLNPFDIPQRIIIVESGNVIITPNVTRIDAWIVVKNGNLVTCAELIGDTVRAREHRSYYGICDNKLDINGYVAADYIAFERTFFEQPGKLASTTDRSVLYGNYGERIVLPYTSMMWAYNKLHISSISQPSVVYTHTLAPRY